MSILAFQFNRVFAHIKKVPDSYSCFVMDVRIEFGATANKIHFFFFFTIRVKQIITVLEN